jgi:hypothetical protein
MCCATDKIYACIERDSTFAPSRETHPNSLGSRFCVQLLVFTRLEDMLLVSVGPEGTWGVGLMGHACNLHGVWVQNEHHQCYTAWILLHLHKCMPYAILGWFAQW